MLPVLTRALFPLKVIDLIFLNQKSKAESVIRSISTSEIILFLIITIHLEVSREVRELKTKLSDLKQSLEFTAATFNEKVSDLNSENGKFKTKIKELYEYQIDPKFVENKVVELENWKVLASAISEFMV